MKLFSRKKLSTEVTISSDTIFRAVIIVIVVMLGWRILNSITYQLTLVGIAAFLAIALNPAVTRISKSLKSRSRVLATGIAYLMVLFILAGIIASVFPPLIKQTTTFFRDIPQTVSDFQAQDSPLARLVVRLDLNDDIANIGRDLSSRFSDFSGPALDTAGRIGGTLFGTITVLVLAFMMLIEGPIWIKRITDSFPEEDRAQRKRVLNKMYRVVTGYVNGQVLIAAIAAAFAVVALFIGSTIAGVSINPIALAGIVFIFGLIPLIGNTLAAVIVVIITLFSSVGLAIGMAIFFLVYQQVENATLQPYIQAKTNQLTPLIVFVAALLGAGLGGLFGALAAIPLAGCLRVLFDEYVADKLPTTEETAEEYSAAEDVKDAK